MGLGVGSQVERGFSWERKGPLKAWVMALRLKAHTADAAMLLLYRESDREEKTAGREESTVIFTTAQMLAVSEGISEIGSTHRWNKAFLQCFPSFKWKSYHLYLH